MNKPNMIDDIGTLRIKCINLESEILVLKKELAESEAEITRLKALFYFHHESYCMKCGSAETVTE